MKAIGTPMPQPNQPIYYTGDNFPLLKNLFLFGTYTGNIYGIYFDNKSQSVTDEIHIKLQHYPFEPVIGIAQSPDGNIYSGSYHINKLTSIELNDARQDLFSDRDNFAERCSYRSNYII